MRLYNILMRNLRIEVVKVKGIRTCAYMYFTIPIEALYHHGAEGWARPNYSPPYVIMMPKRK